MQRFFENHLTLPCWYSLESSCKVLTNEYLCAEAVLRDLLVAYPMINIRGTIYRVILFDLDDVRGAEVCPTD